MLAGQADRLRLRAASDRLAMIDGSSCRLCRTHRRELMRLAGRLNGLSWPILSDSRVFGGIADWLGHADFDQASWVDRVDAHAGAGERIDYRLHSG